MNPFQRLLKKNLDTQSTLYRIVIKSPFRIFAKAIYDGLVGLELLTVHMIAGFSKSGLYSDVDFSDLTVLIKTFERPALARRAVDSVKKYYPGLKIVVVDDSRDPKPIPGVKMVFLPFYSGISIGRNAGLDGIDTQFFLLMDDDHVLYSRTNLFDAFKAMQTLSEIDIMGGRVVNLPFFYSPRYRGQGFIFPTDKQSIYPKGTLIGQFPVFDKTENFFIGRTERVKLIKWDPLLKTDEHADFFTRAKGRLTTVFNSNLRVLHARTPFNQTYNRFRYDSEEFRRILRQRYYKDQDHTG